MTDKPDSIDTLLAAMTPEIHQQLKTAVELGHWENGVKLTPEQQENCLQAVIAYDSRFMHPEQRVGYLNRPGNACASNRKGSGENNSNTELKSDD